MCRRERCRTRRRGLGSPRGPHDDEFASPLLDRLLVAGQLVCERRNNEESRCRLSLSSSFAAVHQLASDWRHTALVTDIVIPSKMTRRPFLVTLSDMLASMKDQPSLTARID